jgi:hypothetical protein
VNNNEAGRRGVEDPCTHATVLRQSDALLVFAPGFEAAGIFSMVAAAPSQRQLLQGASPGSLREVYRAAHDAGLQALQEEVAAAAAGVSDSSSWVQLLETLEPIQVSVLVRAAVQRCRAWTVSSQEGEAAQSLFCDAMDDFQRQSFYNQQLLYTVPSGPAIYKLR